MRVLVIDNYDSFTFNLVQYLGELGADLVVRRNDQVTLDGISIESPDRIVISPGPGHPADAGIVVEAIRAFGARVPILGVCLGHQAIGLAFGGRVVRAPHPVHGKTSDVLHDGKGVFAGIASPFSAARYHSLVVSPADWPAALVAAARTPDGIVMGLRHCEWPIHGVQFHPESILTGPGRQILRNFLEMGSERVF
jgi:anthranilate synthase/aminodeoxychorismate synthase-like glutamine amidotransferase